MPPAHSAWRPPPPAAGPPARAVREPDRPRIGAQRGPEGLAEGEALGGRQRDEPGEVSRGRDHVNNLSLGAGTGKQPALKPDRC